MVAGLRSLIAAGLLTATTLFPAVPAACAAATAPHGRVHARAAADPPQPQTTDGRPGAGRPPAGASPGRSASQDVPGLPPAQVPTDDGTTGRSQGPGSSGPAGSSDAPTEPGQSPSPSSTATGPSPTAGASDSATASPGRPTPSRSATGSGSTADRPATPSRSSASDPTGTVSGTPGDSASAGVGTALQSPGTSDRPSGDRPGSPYPPLSPHGRTGRGWQPLVPPEGASTTDPSSTSSETAGALRPPYTTERAARVARVLPFGAGLALTGLGLAFIGLRLRRR
ncbi:hypothetical protein C3486_06610 [Streptomyces sp. Ru73]|uniref:hypothetical protein n=1 Tax=Streptomyces sp. Ru73 TaxID=2080748 RepID=UPI000CDCFB6B|nr:hypothetical protein [Streptomyces sp. Ru73]POX42140.1 hypothetical protein C3486_06610 [Streptomyces sp. Ru73]